MPHPRANKDLDGAIKSYLAALKLGPDDARAHYCLALALKAKGDATQAASELKTARTLNPFNPKYQ